MHAALMAMASKKKTTYVNVDEWDRKLDAIKVRKEDMDRLVMNYLVTEVRYIFLSARNLGLITF